MSSNVPVIITTSEDEYRVYLWYTKVAFSFDLERSPKIECYSRDQVPATNCYTKTSMVTAKYFSFFQQLKQWQTEDIFKKKSSLEIINGVPSIVYTAASAFGKKSGPTNHIIVKNLEIDIYED